MPKLPTYTAPLAGLPISGGRRAGAEDFGSGIGEGLQTIAKTGQRAYDDIGDAEARKVLVLSSEIRANYAKRLDDAANSTEDLTAIKQQMNDELSRAGDGLYTSKGQAQLRVTTAGTNQMFDSQANTISVRRASVDARLQGSAFLKSEGELVQKNALYLPIALKNAEAFGNTLTHAAPELRAEIVDGLKSQFNVAAAVASARNDPTGTMAKLDAGQWDLTPEQRVHAYNYAKEQQTGQRVQADYLRVAAERERHAKGDEAFGKHVSDIMNGTGTWTAIDTDPAVLPRDKAPLMNIMSARIRELKEGALRTDPNTFNDLRARIDLPPGDPRRLQDINEVWKQYGTNLTKDDASSLEKRIQDNRSESGQKYATAEAEAIRNLSKELDKSTLLSIDAGGGARVQAFSIYVRDKANEYRNSNPPKDPYELLRPDSKDYIGNAIPLFMTGAQRTQKKLTEDLDKALAPKGERKSLDDIFSPSSTTTAPKQSTVASRREAYVTISKEYSAAADIYIHLLEQKGASRGDIDAARSKRDALKAKADAAHRAIDGQ